MYDLYTDDELIFPAYTEVLFPKMSLQDNTGMNHTWDTDCFLYLAHIEQSFREMNTCSGRDNSALSEWPGIVAVVFDCVHFSHSITNPNATWL